MPGTAHSSQTQRSGSRRSRDCDRCAARVISTPSAAATNPATTATMIVVVKAWLVPGCCKTVQ